MTKKKTKANPKGRAGVRRVRELPRARRRGGSDCKGERAKKLKEDVQEQEEQSAAAEKTGSLDIGIVQVTQKY